MLVEIHQISTQFYCRKKAVNKLLFPSLQYANTSYVNTISQLSKVAIMLEKDVATLEALHGHLPILVS